MARYEHLPIYRDALNLAALGLKILLIQLERLHSNLGWLKTNTQDFISTVNTIAVVIIYF